MSHSTSPASFISVVMVVASIFIATRFASFGGVAALPSQDVFVRDTELTCYNSGSYVTQDFALQAIDVFCNSWKGMTLANGQVIERGVQSPTSSAYMYLSARGVDANGCVISPASCATALRQPISLCNINDPSGKQGGELQDNCARWTADAGSKGARTYKANL